MNSRFTVDIDQLDQAAARLSGLAGFIEAHLDELDRRLLAVLEESWDGLAAAAFDGAQRQWTTAARSFVAEIRTAEGSIRRARDRYIRAAEINRSMA